MSKGDGARRAADDGGRRSAREPGDARKLDQFYTAGHVAVACLNRLDACLSGLGIRPALWIEPSAGTGAFLDRMPIPRRGLDVDPQADGIEAADFLSWAPPPADGPIAVVGNPPFGKNASLAIRFFNQAASFADVIAFIVPRTFEKRSVQDRLDRRFHLEAEMAIPPGSFLFEGRFRNVPCVFQVWRKRASCRLVRPPRAVHPDFVFADAAQADFAFQRIGCHAGRVKGAPQDRSASSHHFIRDLTPERRVAAVLSAIDWSDIKRRTAGCPSIGKAELVAAYAEAVAQAEPVYAMAA